MTTKPEDLALLTRKREGQQGPFSDQVTLKTAYCRALSNAETIRKGKGRGKGKGLGRHPGGSAAGSTNAEDYIFNNKIEMQQVKCHFCQANNIEGTHKCQSCFKWLAGWQLRYAGWKSWPRRPMECSPWIRSTSRSNQEVNGFLIVPDQPRAGRSNFGNLKDAAQTHASRYGKMGYTSIQDRMERDPYYLLNNATAQITPGCCQFLTHLHA